MNESTRLVSFLGTGDYRSTRYFRPEVAGEEVETPYIAFALARMLGAGEVRIACTRAAEEKHGASLSAEFARVGLGAPRFERLEDGKTGEELWENFARLKTLISEPGASEIVLDITHGFRSQPFFAGAVVSFVRAIAEGEVPQMRVVYGAFDQMTPDGRAPIWDLTPFVELVDWTHAIRQFDATGDARPLAEHARRLGGMLSKSWAMGGKAGEQPRFRWFADALTKFGAALANVRTGELLLARGTQPSAAAKLAAAAREVRDEIARYAPPLAEILARIERMASELVIGQDHLGGAEGRRVMAALARRYLRLGRFPEAAIALREGWINLYGEPAACRPGREGYDEARRSQAEKAWSEGSEKSGSVADVRNDLLHGGFRKQPLPASTIRSLLEQLIAEFERAEPVKGDPAAAGTTWFVSRHPGALEWARRKGIVVDRVVAHLNVEDVKPGDTVIGTLPVNLAAEVCARGARYLNLSLDLPEDARGRELTADELERYGARFEAFVVKPE